MSEVEERRWQVSSDAEIQAAASFKRDGLTGRLFGVPELNVYAVLDGASIPDLLDVFDEFQPEYACLYRGELDPSLAECAPYLVQLQPDHPFTTWLLEEGWGKHWGIFATSQADMPAVRKHFRMFLIVKDPDGNQLYFRYYDPRVLRAYLPTCNVPERSFVFGPLQMIIVEDAAAKACLVYSHRDEKLHVLSVNVGACGIGTLGE